MPKSLSLGHPLQDLPDPRNQVLEQLWHPRFTVPTVYRKQRRRPRACQDQGGRLCSQEGKFPVKKGWRKGAVCPFTRATGKGRGGGCRGWQGLPSTELCTRTSGHCCDCPFPGPTGLISETHTPAPAPLSWTPLQTHNLLLEHSEQKHLSF